MKPFHTAISAAFLSISAAGAAHAALLDFTDGTRWSTGPSPMDLTFAQDGISGQIQADGGTNLTFRTIDDTERSELGTDLYAYSSGSDARDGIGISNGDGDEIGTDEVLTISFDSAVNVTRIDFLDLFKSKESNYESVLVTASNGSNYTFSQNIINESGYFTDTGSGLSDFSGITWLTFEATGDLNDLDNGGVNDFAVAALDVAAVPIPAALPLFLSALAGLGFVGYRRRKA